MAKRRAGPAATLVGDIHAALDAIAPFQHAESWDNVGLLAGSLEWPAARALLTIDLTDAVAREALERGANLVIAYHPPIFKAIRAVTPDCDGPTSLLPDLLAARVAIIALHTALDVAAGGTNDVLLDFFDVTERRPLTPIVRESQTLKLVVFVPPAEAERLRAALAGAGAGDIGHYAECSFELHGRGSFRGDETTNPTVGRRGALEHVDEVRLEMVVPRARLAEVVRALYAAHSYEEPAFDLYPLLELPARATPGLGRVGMLRRPMRGGDLTRRLGRAVDLTLASAVGTLDRPFSSVTAAAGAFGSKHFRDRDSLVLTGELKHHDALELLRKGVTAVCLDHSTSERPVLKMLKRRVAAALPDVRFEISRADRPPFARLRAPATRGAGRRGK